MFLIFSYSRVLLRLVEKLALPNLAVGAELVEAGIASCDFVYLIA